MRSVPVMTVVEDCLPVDVDHVDAERAWGGAENAVNVASGANDALSSASP